MKKAKFLLLSLLAVILAAGSVHAARRFPGDTGLPGQEDPRGFPSRRPRLLSPAPALVLHHKYRGHANGCQPGQNCAGVVDLTRRHSGFKYGLYNPPSDMNYLGPAEDVGRPNYPGPERTSAAVVLNKRNQHHIIVNHASDLAMTKDFTIAMWIHPQSPNNWMGLVSKAERNDNYSMMFALTPSGQLAHFTNRTGWRWTQATVPSGDWTHVAVSVGNCNAQYVCLARFYINGSPAPIDSRSGPSSIIPAVQPNTGDLRIGSWFGPPSNESPGNGNFNHNAHAYGPSAHPEYNFNGRIDRTKIWSGVLSDAQILEDFQSGSD